jgi:hypothetical protein
MVEGALIKHLKVLKFIPNKYIPFILLGTGIIVTAIGSQSVDPSVLIDGVITSALAIGSHQIGKLSWLEIANIIVKDVRADLNMPAQGDTTYVQEKLGVTDEQVAEIKDTAEKVEELVEKVIETVTDKDEVTQTEESTATEEVTTVNETTEATVVTEETTVTPKATTKKRTTKKKTEAVG